MSRVLKNKDNVVTQKYKKNIHNGIDLVGKGYVCDNIIAHSDGTVVAAKRDYKYNAPNSMDYGNYVKIKHTNGMYTLYAHMKYDTVCVKVGDKVKKGQTIGYMGNTGHSFGSHLHFEVRDKNDNKIDPTPYINANLPSGKVETEKDRIKALQTALNKDFKSGLAVDGMIGPATTKELKKHYLKYFTKGEFVKWVQKQLKRKGYNIGSYGIDGCYGNDMVSVIKKYQKDKKLAVDGFTGIEVVKSLAK